MEMESDQDENKSENSQNTPALVAVKKNDIGTDNVRNLFDIADSLIDAVSQEAEDSIRAGTPFNATAKTIYEAGGNDTSLEDLPTLSLLESCLLDVHRSQQKSLNERRRMQRDLTAKNFSFAELGKTRPKSPPRPMSRDPNFDTTGTRPSTGHSSRLRSARPGTGQTRPGTGQTRPGTGQTRPGTGQTRPSTGHSHRSRPSTAQSLRQRPFTPSSTGRPGSPVLTGERPLSPDRAQQLAIFEDVPKEKAMGETYKAKFRDTFPAPQGVCDEEWGETAHLREIPVERELRYMQRDSDTMSNLSLGSLQGGNRFTLRNRIRKMVVGESRGGVKGGMETSRTTNTLTERSADEPSLTPSERVMLEWEKKQAEQRKQQGVVPKTQLALPEHDKLPEDGAKDRGMMQTYTKLLNNPIASQGSRSAEMLPNTGGLNGVRLRRERGKPPPGGQKRVRFRDRSGSVPSLGSTADNPETTDGEKRPNLSIFAKPEEPETVSEPPVMAINKKAQRILKEFQEEVKKWKETVGAMNSNTPSQDKALESFGDHLTDKYLCRMLDPLPSSETVKGIRKEVAQQIELIATNNRKPVIDETEQPQLNKLRPGPKQQKPGSASSRRPNPKKAISDGWECSLCHKRNFPQHDTCAVCQRKKGYRPMVNQALVKRTMFKQAQRTLDNDKVENKNGKSKAQNGHKDSLAEFMAEQDMESKANDLDVLSRDIRSVIDGIRGNEPLNDAAKRKQNIKRGMDL